MTILDRILETKRAEIAAKKATMSLASLDAAISAMRPSSSAATMSRIASAPSARLSVACQGSIMKSLRMTGSGTVSWTTDR